MREAINIPTTIHNVSTSPITDHTDFQNIRFFTSDICPPPANSISDRPLEIHAEERIGCLSLWFL